MTASVFTQEIIRTDIDPSELHAIAKKSATSIFLKIKEREKSIREAKDAAKNAAAIKTGMFRWGNTDDKVDATAAALVKTNAALAEMNDLIQESIKFTCTSIQFAQVMHKTMNHLMVSGFKDAHGNIQQLAGESKEFVQLILDEAEDFVSKQLAIEEKHAELQARLTQKEQIDVDQTRRLEQLQSLLEHKNTLDDRQEKAIQILFDFVKQKDQLDKDQSELIQELFRKVQLWKLSLGLSILSIIVSAAIFSLTYLR